MKFQLGAFLTAIQFLTRVPVPGGMSKPGADPALLSACVVYFPIVGALIGAVTGMVISGASQLWSIPIAVLLGLVAEALLTGAFHEDAVADSCDAFGGGWTTDDVLRILKDSRIGSYGTLGLGLAVALRGFGLMELSAGLFVLVAAAAGSLGRFAILPLMAAVPPIVSRDGLSKDIGKQVTWETVAVGAALTLPGIVCFAWILPWNLLVGLVVAAMLLSLWGRHVKRRIGGITGDCLGLGCYLVQIVFTLAATLPLGAR